MAVKVLFKNKSALRGAFEEKSKVPCEVGAADCLWRPKLILPQRLCLHRLASRTIELGLVLELPDPARQLSSSSAFIIISSMSSAACHQHQQQQLAAATQTLVPRCSCRPSSSARGGPTNNHLVGVDRALDAGRRHRHEHLRRTVRTVIKTTKRKVCARSCTMEHGGKGGQSCT